MTSSTPLLAPASKSTLQSNKPSKASSQKKRQGQNSRAGANIQVPGGLNSGFGGNPGAQGRERAQLNQTQVPGASGGYKLREPQVPSVAEMLLGSHHNSIGNAAMMADKRAQTQMLQQNILFQSVSSPGDSTGGTRIVNKAVPSGGPGAKALSLQPFQEQANASGTGWSGGARQRSSSSHLQQKQPDQAQRPSSKMQAYQSQYQSIPVIAGKKKGSTSQSRPGENTRSSAQGQHGLQNHELTNSTYLLKTEQVNNNRANASYPDAQARYSTTKIPVIPGSQNPGVVLAKGTYIQRSTGSQHASGHGSRKGQSQTRHN